jgi:ABC-type multidrug transport system ATPase subunit
VRHKGRATASAVEALTGVLIKLRSESAMSIILVEQNSRVALAFSERTVIMSKGRIVYDGASAALREDPEKLARSNRGLSTADVGYWGLKPTRWAHFEFVESDPDRTWIDL